MHLIAGLVLGFLGSMHCIGMCGPIAMALPQSGESQWSKFMSAAAYNFGRVITYGILGLIFGFLGKGLFLGGLQQMVSILTGIAILAIVLFPFIVPAKFKNISFFQLKWFRTLFAKFLKNQNHFSYILVGMLNGFLPCGFVYIGLSTSILTADPFLGAGFMMFFGLGTIPAMLSLSMLGSWFDLNFRNHIKKAIPIFSIVIALVLILRGFNLGIPYLSPQLNKVPTGTSVDCCEKPELPK